MQMPNVITEVKDPKKNFVFRVRAFRKLTSHEMRSSFAMWYRQRDKRRALRNKVIDVITYIGAND